MMVDGKGLAGQGQKSDACTQKWGVDFLLGFRQEEYLVLYFGGGRGLTSVCWRC